ncbi:LysR family transcriptional regulator [Halomonas sp. V046]|uniref:LysR family transcriptional regulator n=1 Tax=Halomonas sp. V046 TaxID=3459611 RepID=UPI004044CD9B
MDRLDWNLLRTFLVIVQMRSISAAATKLHITQSAVSQSLKRLENQLDRKLVERSGGQFIVTRSGQHVYKVAEAAYKDVSRLSLIPLLKQDDVVGNIKVLVASRIQSNVYDHFWLSFRNKYPAIDVHLEVMRSDDIINTVQKSTAAIGIGLSPRRSKGLERELFLKQRYSLYCGVNHRFFGKESIRLDSLVDEDFVSFSSDVIGGSLSPLTIFRDQHGFTGRVIATSPNYDEIIRLMVSGYGIGSLPRHSADLKVREGVLWKLPPDEGLCDIELYLLWRKGSLTLAGQAFVDEFMCHMQGYTMEERAMCDL